MVWQKSIDLTVEVYRIAKLLPPQELHGLSEQMRRAVVAIPSKIAEGQVRNTAKEFVHSLDIAKGACAELETLIIISVKTGYLRKQDIELAFSQLQDISMLLTRLIKSLTSLICSDRR